MDIREIITQGESQTLEFKESYSDKVVETLVAFANTDGGKVLIGVTDLGKICGTSIGAETIPKRTNKIKQVTTGQLIPIVDLVEIEDKIIVVMSVVSYPIKPISYKDKYYKRVGNSNQPMSTQEVVNLHLQSMQTSWDTYADRSMNIDDIDSDMVKKFIGLYEKRRKIVLEDDLITVLKKFELIDENDSPTYACRFLFHKNVGVQSKVILASFQGNDKMISKDDLVIDGSLLNHVDLIMDFIKKHINKALVLKSGDTRNTQVRDYPLDALREIVINAVVHRDYRSINTTQIFLYADKIEIANPGQFPQGVSLDEIIAGTYKSSPPNKLIARIFKDAGIIEEYGSGVKKIHTLFVEHGLAEPVISTKQGFVTYTCMKENYVSGDPVNGPLSGPVKIGDPVNDPVNDPVKLLYQYIIEHGGVKTSTLEKTFDVSNKTIKRRLKKLKDQGLIEYRGSDKTGGYYGV